MKTIAQKAAQKAQKTLTKRFNKEAKTLASVVGIPVNEAFAQVRKDFYDKAVAKRKATQATKKIEGKSLAHITTNPSKQLIYCMLGYEAWTLKDDVHAITMPSQSTDFELHLQKQNNATFSFIERDKEIAQTISKNFANVPHTLYVGQYPEKTQDIRIDYHKANFVWLDFMGCFLSRYYDEIALLMQTCMRNEMVFAVTIGSRGSSKTADKPNNVAQKLRNIFCDNGWSVDRMTINQYKSTNNVLMYCLSFHLYNPSNGNMDIEKMNELSAIKLQIAELENKLSELKGSEPTSELTDLKTPCQKAWETRRDNTWLKRAIELRKSGKTYQAIADELGINIQTVHGNLRKLDLPKPAIDHKDRAKKAWESRIRNNSVYSKKYNHELAVELREKGWTYQEIGEQMGLSATTISLSMQRCK